MMPGTSGNVSQHTAGSSPVAVHRCRFVDYTPAAITAIAIPPLVLPTSRKLRPGHSQRKRKGRFGPLAVGRSNGNVELYEWAIPPREQEHTVKAPQAWVLSKILYGPSPSKVDSLAFTLRYPHLLEYNEVPTLADLRLFSTGGGSELVEWDIASGTILRTLNSQGGAIWSMAANPASTRLALGCEDGCVRLIDVSDGEMSHIRRFDRTKSRILSIAWGPPTPPPMLQKEKEPEGTDDSASDEDEDDEWTDIWLVTGGSDSSARKWDAKTGRVLDRMTTDKARGERTLVWAVGVLGDGTIVSGDSLGIVKFWDSRTCTQLHSFPAHGADVLCMTIGPDGNSVFTSGVDQKVCLFTNVRISESDKAGKSSGYKSKTRWVQSTSKRMHSHDVRALATWPPHLPITNSLRSAITSSIPNPFSGVAPILASGGLDASLVLAPCATAGISDAQVNPLATSAVSTFEDAYHRRIAYPTGLSPAISVARIARLLVCRRDADLSVWRIIGQARVPSALEADLRAADAMEVDSATPGPGAPVGKQEQECGYEKLLDMELDAVTNLSSSAISDDGRWLAVSDAYEVKLFELIADSGSSEIRPRRVKLFMPIISAHLSLKSSSTEGPEGASALGFTPDGCRLVLAAARSASLLVIDLTGRTAEGRPEPRVLRKFDHHARREALFAHGRVIREMPVRPNGIPKVNGFSKSDAPNESSDSEVNSAGTGHTDVDEGENDEGTEEDDEHALVTRIAFSPDGQWFATTDDRYRTHIFNLDSVQHHTILPTSPTLVTALTFLPRPPSVQPGFGSSAGPLLVLVHADSTIGVFDVEARRFAPWAAHLAQREHLPRRWTNLHDSVLGMAVEPPSSSLLASKNGREDSERHVLFWGATWLCRVKLDAPIGWGGFIKKRRRDAHPVGSRGSSLQASNSKSKRKGKNKVDAKATLAASGSINPNISGTDAANVEDDEETMSNFKLVTRYRPILKVDFLDVGELLVVERPLLDVLRDLPPAFFKPRYGT